MKPIDSPKTISPMLGSPVAYSSLVMAAQGLNKDLASILPEAAVEDAIDHLARLDAPNLVVTMGGSGAVYRSGSGWLRSVKPMKSVSESEDGLPNFTGAGDSFGGGFMASLVRNRNIDSAVVHGNHHGIAGDPAIGRLYTRPDACSGAR